ncbi:hypothetical protein [Nonomuraea typhae]|uniref:hypothetical protein n=1 Tax=Nonomuraea typhae TaxID=2603600 RepID=UPI0012FBD284|nr:hypothetical protein [Nonomuraea typhae]
MGFPSVTPRSRINGYTALFFDGKLDNAIYYRIEDDHWWDELSQDGVNPIGALAADARVAK